MSFVEDRIQEIERKYTSVVQDLIVLSLTDETFRLILSLIDGTTVRVVERWRSGKLLRYSYYWLDSENRLLIGWDNSPHHEHLPNYPHHKHVGEQAQRVTSYETCLEDVMNVLEKEIGSRQ